ncbi:hypothetical protein theurythT_20110 [Thalassotalea eurytherma]|uniref:Uncharacterized protein n=1 Tax=Thalassotalea eurytherma TaxID=1144278 RepID=A0ABQ6H3Q3_9GAMM|nr:hypothetical protein theurythT_20110 [Thalassotalea eurytherma]
MIGQIFFKYTQQPNQEQQKPDKQNIIQQQDLYKNFKQLS